MPPMTNGPEVEPDLPVPAGAGQGSVLVTGAFGLVGSAVVHALAMGGHRVVATDLDTPANRASASRVRSESVEVRWADLTRSDQVDDLVRTANPKAVVHLAAVIPPMCYRHRGLARMVNVGATESLVRSAAARDVPPRFIQASSVAVYGPRNPHRVDGLLTPETPVRPADLYGALKAEAEEVVRSSGLEWLVLRLGGVLTSQPKLMMDADTLYFEATLPADGRIQTVDVRDVADAFAAAVLTPVSKEVFLIGGDESHRLRQRDLGARVAAALGLVDGIPPARPGDPESDEDWFVTDWMDTTRSQQVLAFQHHSLPEMLDEIRERMGAKRYPLRLAAPFVRRYLSGVSPYRNSPGEFAQLWTAIGARLGDPAPDHG